MPTRSCPRPRRRFCTALTLSLFAVIAATGCDQVSGRLALNRGNRLYSDGRYLEAVSAYEEGLAKLPDFVAGHHNCGLAYYKLFRPGVETPKNLAYANKAAAHLTRYLDENPDDTRIVSLLTTTWMDSGNYKAALAYWEDQLKEDPKSHEVLVILANINKQAGDYDKALSWIRKRIDAEAQTQGKVDAYMDIGKLELSRLRNPDVVGKERLVIADTALAALQKAAALDSKDPMIHSYMASIFKLRSLAHGSSWARVVEDAAWRKHLLRWRDLTKAAEAETDSSATAGNGAKGG
ncbi:MAG TPA: tetratricopeptide repeat protein [Kofleriaceae bacterium]|nr:tetratricopeptide repeat protein [Kofleriaceae bacterium]